MSEKFTRRRLLSNTALAIGTAGFAGTAAQARVAAGADPFDYEITRTEEEWRALLSDDDYKILRDGETEIQFTHPYWNEKARGMYHCKGCDLELHSSEHKYFPDKGWVFFTASVPNSLLMAIDARSEMVDEMLGEEQSQSELNEIAGNFFIETHCRRCGSHIGHVLPVAGRALHCVNGASLVFKEAAA